MQLSELSKVVMADVPVQAGHQEGAPAERPCYLASDGVFGEARGQDVWPRVLHSLAHEPLPPQSRQVPVRPHR